MSIKSTLFCAISSVTLALSVITVSIADLLPITAVSIQVQPQVATRSPGSRLSLDVRSNDVSDIGTRVPVTVSGAPEGTSIEVLPQSAQYTLISLVFPATVMKGRYTLSVVVGNPEPIVEQKIIIEIGDELP